VGNLVLNAVEASPAGAEVAVTTAVRDDEHVEVIIDDLGPGVPPEVRERVFEPYFTTKEGGTGLGLAMVYKVVAEHGGRIEIEDRPGGGGRFRIMLPTAEAARDAADRVAAEAQAQADRMPPAAVGEAGGPGPAAEGSPSTAGGERERRVNG
jgi:nitrogen-specific signal transduction histidine kinase